MHNVNIIPVGSKSVALDNSVDSPQAIGANSRVTLLTDVSGSISSYTFSRTWIQNTGGATAYFSLGADCDISNYDGQLPANQSLPLELTPFLGKVSVFSVVGTTVAAVRMFYNEIAPAQGGILNVLQKTDGQ